MKGLRISLAAITALFLMAGCGTIGDVLGTGSPNSSNTQSISGNVNSIDYNARRIDLSSNNGQFTITGTVSGVDTNNQRIDLYSAYTTGLRTNGGQGNYSVYYNSNTPVYYQNTTYSPTALERGDQVSISAYDNGGGRYVASSINVTRNVRNQ